MPVHQATTDGNAERRALGQRLRFSNFGYDVGGSSGKSLENIIPHVNCEVDFWVRFADRTALGVCGAALFAASDTTSRFGAFFFAAVEQTTFP